MKKSAGGTLRLGFSSALANFIGRNLAWVGLWLLVPRHLEALGDHPEVFVLLPELGAHEPEGRFVWRQARPLDCSPLRLSALLSLYPGRCRTSDFCRSDK